MKQFGTLLIFSFLLVKLSAEKYSFQHITTNDGLPNNSILCIGQDSIGRMWFGTYDGLCMYDGLSYKSFNYESSKPETSIGDNQIHHLEVDYKGNVWVQLANGNISRLIDIKKEQFINYRFSGGAHLNISETGKVLISSNEGVKTFNYENNHFELCSEQMRWSKDYNYRNHLLKLYPNTELIGYFQVSKTEAWFSSRYQGVFHVTGDNTTGKINVTRVQHDANNKLSIISNEVYAVFEDASGILWTGTKDRGISKLLPQISQIKTLSFKEGNRLKLPASPIRALAKDAKNNLWLGTYHKGVIQYQLKNNTYKRIHLAPHLHEDWNRIRSIYKTSDQSMWVGSYGGLYRINRSGEITYYDECILGNHQVKRIYSMLEDNNGYLWIGGWNGLDRIDIKTGKIEHVLSDELSDEHIRNLFLDKHNVLWIATEFGGISKYDITSKTIEFVVNTEEIKPLNCNSIFHITQINTGDFWISTFSGITAYNPHKNTYTHLNLELPSDLVYGVLQDKNNEFWISTGNGVVWYDKNLKQCRAFDNKDGWISTQMCEGALFKSEQNELFFGGNGGINFFKPEGFTTNNIPPKPYLCFGQQKVCLPQSSPEVLSLDYFNDGLNLNLSAYHYLEPSKNKIAYRIWPKDTTWHNSLGSQVSIVSETLGAGTYQLQYKAANADGKWTEVFTHTIEVAQPFWYNPLFAVGILLTILIGVAVGLRFKVKLERKKSQELELLVKKRTHQIEKQQEQLQQKNEELAASNKSILAQKNKITHQHGVLLELHEQLTAANEMKMQFFSNLAHEFRTPLTLISGPIEQLISTHAYTDEEGFRKLSAVRQQTDVLISLVNQLLDFKKLESGYMSLNKTKGELIPFCHNIVGSFEFEAASKNIDLTFNCAHQHIYAYYDSDKLRQILVNLLSNAFKFTKEGGRVALLLALDEDKNKINIQLCDNGIGISIEHINNIFNRFYQASKSLDLTKPGTGLGLSLSKKLAELHGGDIGVESAEGEGSCFTLQIPYEPYVLEEVEQQIHLGEENHDVLLPNTSDAVMDKQKQTVLIVDDHPDIVSHVASVLSPYYNTLKAANGLEALKMIKQKTVDVILSDWLMPQMDGLSFCAKVKENKSWQQIPVIIITALNSSTNHLKALQNGADDFISKPFSNELLLAKVQNLLQREKALLQSKSIANSLEPINKKQNSQEELMAKKLGEVVNKYLSEADFNPEVLGEKMGWSKMQLYRKVKHATGITPNELIQSSRLKRGKQLLEEDGFRVSEVCYAVGFNDPKYFSRCFQKAFGMKPSEYQEIKKKEKEQTVC